MLGMIGIAWLMALRHLFSGSNGANEFNGQKALPPGSADTTALTHAEARPVEQGNWLTALVNGPTALGFRQDKSKWTRISLDLGIATAVAGLVNLPLGLALFAYRQFAQREYYKTKGMRLLTAKSGQRLREKLRRELNGESAAFDHSNYLRQRENIEKRFGLAPELYFAQKLKNAHAKILERELDLFFGPDLESKLRIVLEGRVPNGLNLVVHILGKAGQSKEVYGWLLAGLGELGDPRALPALQDWADSKEWRRNIGLRRSAIFAIEKIRNANIADELNRYHSWGILKAISYDVVTQIAEGLTAMTRQLISRAMHLKPIVKDIYSLEATAPQFLQHLARAGRWEQLEEMLSGEFELPIDAGVQICELLLNSEHPEKTGSIDVVQKYLLEVYLKPYSAREKELGRDPELEHESEAVQIETIQLMTATTLLNLALCAQRLAPLPEPHARYFHHGLPKAAPSVRLELAKALLKIAQHKNKGLIAKAVSILKDREILTGEHSLEAGALLDQAEPGWAAQYIQGTQRP